MVRTVAKRAPAQNNCAQSIEGITVVMQPTPLRSLAEIQAAFGVSREKIRQWHEYGAPIVINEKGGYSAEYMTLHLWRLTGQ
ncbi:hypothetical protein [Desulfovibrio cuneatus]|uniref:hypothetical protein n=1 Tax=Desulfovibrio cuneatus TaxID=159728 RepID=UPI000419CEBD|nr:hypothetical protein [Desulfovibrio cuneatus]